MIKTKSVYKKLTYEQLTWRFRDYLKQKKEKHLFNLKKKLYSINIQTQPYYFGALNLSIQLTQFFSTAKCETNFQFLLILT